MRPSITRVLLLVPLPSVARRLLLAWLLGLPLLFLAASLRAQDATHDLLRGRVQGADGAGLRSVTVNVLPAGATSGRYTRTDSTGNWSLLMDGTAPSYTVSVTAIGMQPTKTTVQRNAGQPTVVNITLRKVQELEALRITESRRRPPPRDGIGIANDQAASEKFANQAPGSVASADAGNLASMAASIPGVSLIADANGGPPSFSVLGLSGDQNNVTLNGVQFSGGDIPRDAIASTRVTTSSFDVSRGGFSGGQLAISSFAGGNFHQRNLHVTLDAPSLQFTDAVGRQLGTRYTNGQISGSLFGPIVYDHVFYNTSFQVGRRSSNVQSLLANDSLSMYRVGLSPDSLASLQTALAKNGIPLAGIVSPGARQRDNASVLTRIDWNPSQTVVGNIVASGRHSSSSALFMGATAVPGHGGEESASGGDVTATMSAYINKNILNDLRLGGHLNDTHDDPYLNLPDARVLVISQLADSSTGISALAFGGNGVLPRDTRNDGGELFDQVSWLSEDGRHRTRVTLDARDDGFSQDQYSNRRGSYVYNSIADVNANTPASYSRTFVSHPVSASAWNNAFAVGDIWRPTDRSSLTYGLRFEQVHFNDAPEYNGAVDTTFHVRTDNVPSEVHVSPRAGFSLGLGNRGTKGLPGAPLYFLRGGIGEFRNSTNATLIAPAMRATGLSDAVTQIQCVGSAVPTPNWTGFEADPSTIPTQCAGSGPASFASTQPNVFLIGPDYAAQRAWRSNLAVQGPFFTKWIVLGVEGVYSRNLHQQSSIDLNFNGQQQFTLAGESNRPVFVQPSSIVAATGAMTNHDSRLSSQFGSVTELTSNFRSTSRQVIFSLTPLQFVPGFTWNASYVLSNVQDQARGFGGSTAGNPLDVEWGRSSMDVRHQVNASVTLRARDVLSLSLYSRFQSGSPFTPIVAGDINGDGLSNDRAFIYSSSATAGAPGFTPDTTLRKGMAALISGASPRVRDCLLSQQGQIAIRNSCQGPWTALTNAAIALNPEKLGMQNRVALSLQFTNLPAAMDEFLHGTTHLQGWGQPAFADPSLLTVQGFDKSTQSFKYAVNQRFGDTRLTRTSVRAPFLITLDARIEVGHLFTDQAMDQIMAPGRQRSGDRLTAAQIKQRALNGVFNPLTQLLQVKDSLTIITKAQLQQLTDLQRQVAAHNDSILDPVIDFLVKQPKDFNREMVLDTVYAAQLRMFDGIVAAMRQVKQILTPEQVRELPPFMMLAFDEKMLMITKPTRAFFPNY